MCSTKCATKFAKPRVALSTARSIFVHDDEVAVTDRALPAFSATGVPVGNFDIYPGLAIGGLFDSNVLADNSRRHADAAVVIRPELIALTSGGPYQFSAFVRGDIRRFTKFTTEDTQEVQGGAQGSLAIGPLSSLSAGVSYGSLIDPRFSADSPANALRPLNYRALDGFASGTIEGASTAGTLSSGSMPPPSNTFRPCAVVNSFFNESEKVPTLPSSLRCV